MLPLILAKILWRKIDQRLIDLGDELSEAKIIGIDLSSTQSKWYVELQMMEAPAW